jgi:MoaA/NifB/PqqE/SkfB family radical SAM enzyme
MMESTNRRWQNHLRAKGINGFFLDRLQSHALSSDWQYSHGAFDFPVMDRERDDELSRTYFEFIEDFPYEFYLEVTNHCNLECEMCARQSLTRSLGTMSVELFRKIVDEIAEKQPAAFIHYYGIGESMLDKRLFEKLDYSKSLGLNNSLLFTNGQLLLTNDNYKKLADSCLSNIGVDIDAMTADTYSKIRIGGDFDKMRNGIEALYQYVRKNNLRKRIELAYQVYSGINDHELDEFVAWCEKNEFEYKIVTMHSWAGLRSDVQETEIEGLAQVHHASRNSPCLQLWNGFTIAWDGRVGLCFRDADLQEVQGNLNDESIEQVWKESLRKNRSNQVNGKFTGLCSGCYDGSAVRLPSFNSRLYPEILHKK